MSQLSQTGQMEVHRFRKSWLVPSTNEAPWLRQAREDAASTRARKSKKSEPREDTREAVRAWMAAYRM